MIFKGGYRKITAGKQIKSGGLGFFQSFIWAAVSVLLALAVYFVLLLLTRRGTSVPAFLHTTHFGLLYLYTIANSLVIFAVLFIRIRFICFSEIMTGRWTLMTSMGIPIGGLVGMKTVAAAAALARQYGIGSLIILLCGSLFGMPFSINYLLALFFAGLINLILFIVIAMALTVFIRRIESARINLAASFLIVQVISAAFGFYHSGAFDAEKLKEMFSLRPPSYLSAAALLILVCYAVMLAAARYRSLHQELMPLSVFDIRPLISDGGTELFTTSGMRYTTVLDADLMRSERGVFDAPAGRPAAAEEMSRPAGQGRRSGLLIACLAAESLGVLLLILSLLGDLLDPLLGEALVRLLASQAVRAVLGILIVVFSVLTVILILRRNRGLPEADE